MKKKSLILALLLSVLFVSCSIPKFAKPGKISKNTPINAKERARKNVTEGRGLSLKQAMGGARGSTNYEFSSSNPLWRSSLEILDFLPLTTVDYSGGIIITDWYSESAKGDSIKITVRFLSNEIRSDSIKIIIHSKNCPGNQNCQIINSNPKIKKELQRSILTKASLFEKETKEKK